ncbi:MAG TPA: LytTR family DNA-binding domain-containing protein [Ramlibacter sp.]|uniref:LytR/AlgR family response regulator transcription factor n=1 Tax=Ramlibacter sp. TaxID=1917967 RepID=UPI002D152EA9|nr:LytTR family DNA-binding domain-containing protein [Ramlibacter sp.]HVZ45667.1 LytTR family DNA-binding domain-containing protein [Ramlibacter sp.]
MPTSPTALIAEDEPLLRERLATLLARLWPELAVAAQARNGTEAIELFEAHRPRIAFLDVHMPGVNGIEVARTIGERAEVVFVTAFDRYAIQAFERGAVDYVLKPLEADRLAETVERLKRRLQANARSSAQSSAQSSQPPPQKLLATLDALAEHWRERMQPEQPKLQWIKASAGNSVRLIPVEQVVYLKSDNKYTLVVWEGGEALIRKTIKEMADSLDPQRFAQVHRSCIVNLARVSHMTHVGDAGELQLHGRAERLAVSRSFMHLFQQM